MNYEISNHAWYLKFGSITLIWPLKMNVLLALCRWRALCLVALLIRMHPSSKRSSTEESEKINITLRKVLISFHSFLSSIISFKIGLTHSPHIQMYIIFFYFSCASLRLWLFFFFFLLAAKSKLLFLFSKYCICSRFVVFSSSIFTNRHTLLWFMVHYLKFLQTVRQESGIQYKRYCWSREAAVLRSMFHFWKLFGLLRVNIYPSQNGYVS